MNGLNDKKVILDTCTLQYLDDKDLVSQMLNVLAEFHQDNLSISEYAIYELLRGANKIIESKRRKVLTQFKRHKIDTIVLSTSALLATLYNENGLGGKTFSDGDQILASTAILTNSIILTADGRDYPLPFFKEVKRWALEYTKTRKSPCILYALEPDYNILKISNDNRK